MRQDLYAELYQIENNHWWHHHKRALVHQMITHFCPEKGKVLDVGAGTGKMLQELKQSGWQIFGIDTHQEAIKQSKRRDIPIQLIDIAKQSLPYQDNSFDLVIALDTLEHIANDKKAIKEINRVIKPAGIIILTVPAYQWLFCYWDKMLGHYRRYSSKTLKRLVNNSGLEILFLSYFFSYLLLPTVITRLIRTILRQKKVSDFKITPLNWLVVPFLKLLSKIERSFLKSVSLPFGSSLICIARKK